MIRDRIPVKPHSKRHRLAVACLFAVIGGALIWFGSLGGSSGNRNSPGASGSTGTVVGPIRAAFYYPWFPEAWKQQGFDPFTQFHPSLGFYSSDDPVILSSHVASMVYGGLNSGIASWWGPGTPTDARVPALLKAATGTGFKWSLYYEAEGSSDPSVAKIKADLAYAHKYAVDDRYLKVATNSGALPVIFVYGGESCSGAQRWKDAAGSSWLVVLKVFAGYKSCSAQPYRWHQYAPAVRSDHQAGFSYSVSPGFWKKGEPAARLARDVPAFTTALQAMVASKEPVQLVTTFNEWGEGSSVESASEWATSGDNGAYLDVMHRVLAPPPPPPPTGTTTPPPPTTTAPPPTTAPTGSTTPPPPPTTAPPTGGITIAAAGDISCESASCPGSFAVAALIRNQNPDAVLTLGDNQYETGSLSAFNAFFNASWGGFTSGAFHPAVGNHEYGTTNAAGYTGYFAAKNVVVGADNGLAYSWDQGGVHFVALNSECSHISACGPENTWLGGDLAAHPAACTVAYWHEPFRTNGQHGNAVQMATIWSTLARNGVDIVLSGHNHSYERFNELDAAGNPVTGSARGIREFVVGTGGKNHYAITRPKLPGEVVTNDQTFGALFLSFAADGSYTWAFRPISGSSFTDQGSGSCHA